MTTAKRLWVIEDDETISQCLCLILSENGYGVAPAKSLAEARCLEQKPDLVLLDFLLPDGNGIAFLPELAVRHPGVPVILLTAQERVGMSRFPHHVAYLAKPFRNKELFALIQSQLSKSMAIS